MRWLSAFVGVNVKLLLLISLLVNLGLGVLNFVVQPLWRAAAVASALAVAEVKSEAEERRAVAKARAKEKSKARLRRVAVAVPVLGIGAVSAFEYVAYQEWVRENPDTDASDYIADVVQESRDVAPDVVAEVAAHMPAWMVPDPEALVAGLEAALQGLSPPPETDADEGAHGLPAAQNGQ